MDLIYQLIKIIPRLYFKYNVRRISAFESLMFITSITILSSCSGNNSENQTNSASVEARDISKDSKILPVFPDTLIQVSAGQLSMYKTIIINDIPFKMVKEANGDTTFLETRDKAFRTPEGYKVGMNYKQIKSTHRKKINKEPGWGYYIELPSKWNLQFHIGETATDHQPVDTSKVTFIFKRQ